MHWYTKYRGVDDDLPIIIVPENVFEHAKKRVSEEKRYERKQRLQKKLDQIILKKSDCQNKRKAIPIRQDYVKPARPCIPKTRLERKLVIESEKLKFLNEIPFFRQESDVISLSHHITRLFFE